MFAGRVRVGTHDMQNGQDFQPVFNTVFHCSMFGHRTSDVTSVSLSIFHALQSVWKLSAANVLIFIVKSAMLIFVYTGYIKRNTLIFARQKKQCNFHTGIAIFSGRIWELFFFFSH